MNVGLGCEVGGSVVVTTTTAVTTSSTDCEEDERAANVDVEAEIALVERVGSKIELLLSGRRLESDADDVGGRGSLVSLLVKAASVRT